MVSSKKVTHLNKNKAWLKGLWASLAVLSLVLGYVVYAAQLEMIYLAAFLWIVSVIILLWYGNRTIFELLDSRFPWSKHTSKRFLLQLFCSSVFSLFCINSTYYLFRGLLTEGLPTPGQLVVLNVYGLLFIIPVLSIIFGIFFMNQWKKAHLLSDRLREENLRTQLESLRMQLDPHFLFNNLNVLSSLIDSDRKTAQEFLDKFAEVYRYVLQYKKEELVPLNTEIDFIESYVFLLKKRFESQLRVEIAVSPGLSDRICIPPLSLQLLIENAIKHNAISSEKPLLIRVFLEEDKWLIVENSLQLKNSEGSFASGTGLDSIRKRYEYLSESPIEVSQDERRFVVRLPLLEML
ncbi:sensor histidine kinase [Pedobacter sp. SYSU D00535]|uniref:sensor histidine kinase n=1 Tax=Pedobacter sp. SYSU D00535 TaxID=2810308 RepID=UPI001F61A34E|nr:histidine kinase [Pedobacter sp. SYSU D00535]